MTLLRAGERGTERPAAPDDSGAARDVSGVAGGFRPAFAVGDGPAGAASATGTALAVDGGTAGLRLRHR